MITRVHTGWPIPASDPYPALEALRETGPLHWIDEAETFLAVSYEAAQAVLHGAEWSSDPSRADRISAWRSGLGLAEPTSKSIIFSDPPDHARLRAAVTPFFGRAAVASLQPRVAQLARAAWIGLASDGQVEVMTQVAYALPLAVISELMDLPLDVTLVLRDETANLTAVLDPLATDEDLLAAAASAGVMMMALAPIVVERRHKPGTDLLSQLATVSGLETDEAVLMALLLSVAGHETTANLIANGIAALYNHPQAARLLHDHPSLATSVVEEIIRYDGPVQLLSRVALIDTSLCGLEVPEGSQALVSLGAANRDPSTFVEPTKFEPRREHHRHLGFGHGTHFCVGAWLARIEAQEALTSLLAFSPDVDHWHMDMTRSQNRAFRRVERLVLRTQ